MSIRNAFQEIKEAKEEHGIEAALRELHVWVTLRHLDKNLAREYAEKLGLVKPKPKKRRTSETEPYWWKPK